MQIINSKGETEKKYGGEVLSLEESNNSSGTYKSITLHELALYIYSKLAY